MKKPVKPVKEYGTLKSYTYRFMKYGEDNYRCLDCNGYGWYRKFEDRDIIEGYKLAQKYECHKCRGTGDGKMKDYAVLYKEYSDEYNKYYQKYRKDLELYKSIKSKLTKEELEFLK